MRTKKFKAGRIIKSVGKLCDELWADRYVMLKGIPKHPGFVMSMQFRTIRLLIIGGKFRYAKENR